MKPLAITLGDPAGIGPEVVLAAFSQLKGDIPCWFFGDWDYTLQLLGSSRIPAEIERVVRIPSAGSDSRSSLFIDVALSRGDSLTPGRSDARYGKIALASLDRALEAITSGSCSALVTAPVNKEALIAAGAPFPGHTEILAQKSGLKKYGVDFAMYFDSPTLKVALLSVHVPLRETIALVTAAAVASLAALVDREYLKLYGARPRISVAGLNPHAGESGLLGDEEKLISEGVRAAAESGITISGPFAPDTIFLSAVRGKADVVIAMYHDQGLIPIKTIDFERSVNVTLGLPYLRCSVDHGTAFDIAGKGLADAAPMKYAIEWAAEHGAKFRK